MSIDCVLLTGGRAPVTLDLARMLRREGVRVLVAESRRLHLCTGSSAVARNFHVPSPRLEPDRYVEALARIIAGHGVDMLVPTCEEVCYVARGLPRLRPLCTVLTSSLEQVLALHHKHRFVEKVRALGEPVPATWLVESPRQWKEVHAGLACGQRVVLKAAYSRFAARVHFVQAGRPWPAIPVSRRRPWLVQERIDGRGLCCYSVAHGGVLSAHAAYRVIHTAGPGSCIWFASLDHPGLRAWVERFVASESYTGQIAFDFIETADGTLFPLECNPRATSGVHLLAPQRAFWRALQGAGGDVVQPDPRTRRMLAAAMVLYGLRGVRCLRDLGRWWRDWCAGRDVIASLRDPWPALVQFVALADLAWEGMRAGVLPMEAATMDIEWSEDL